MISHIKVIMLNAWTFKALAFTCNTEVGRAVLEYYINCERWLRGNSFNLYVKSRSLNDDLVKVNPFGIEKTVIDPREAEMSFLFE